MISDAKIKQCGKIYKHITDAVKANYGRYSLPWKYDALKAAIVKSKDAEVNTDIGYPVDLHEAFGDIVLRWCAEGYPDTGEDDIYKIFLQLWKFHKKWMLFADTHTASEITAPMDKEATDQIAELCSKSNYANTKERRSKITSLYVAVMSYVIDIAKEEPEDCE